VSGHKTWTAALIVIGDEILSGRTEDKNIAQVARWLNGQGIRLQEVRVVPDVEEAIVEAVQALGSAYDHVITTGGIGPTHDDITIDSVAKAFGVPVIVDERARAILQSHYDARGVELTESRLRMARIPEGADLIDNPTSGAPGVKIGNVHILAGVPNIAAAMLESLNGKLQGGAPVASVTIRAHAAESEVAGLLKEVQDQFPSVSIGSYPFYREGGGFGADFVVRSDDVDLANRCAEELRKRLQASGVELIETA